MRNDGGQRVWLVGLGAVVSLTLGGVAAALRLLDTSSSTALPLSSDVLALMGLVVLSIPAYLVMRARDSRRYVLGVLALAVLWLLLWYPNISGLPLPSDFAAVYQGILPTWNWDFQFSVNTDIASEAGVVDRSTLVIGAITVVLVAGVGWAARMWGRAPRKTDALAEIASVHSDSAAR